MGSRARMVNGVISALILVFFVAHSILGGLEGLLPLHNPPVQVMWAGIVLVCMHVIASAVTSWEQLTDVEFPPSRRKKRHLALKWATGAALLAAIVSHIACMRTFGPDSVQVTTISTIVPLLLVTAMAVHAWVGAKSLVTDLKLKKSLIVPFRVLVCALAIAAGAIVVAGMM